MTYGANQRILAEHFNNFAGVSNTPGNPLAAYPNIPASLTNKVGALWGVGSGSWGYGRSTPVITNVDIGGRITATNWNNLVTINNNIATKTGVAITNYVPINAGDRIAHLAALEANIATLNNNRFSSSSRVFSPALLTNTRATNWNTFIDSTINCTYADGNIARYFFNSGSEILVRVRHNSSLTLQDSNWNTFLSTQVGDIYVGPNYTRQTASSLGGITGAGFGYWNMTGSLTGVFDRSAGTGVYSGQLRCRISIARVGATNVSGNSDNGNVMQIQVRLDDNYAGLGDNIQGGQTTVQIFTHTNNSIFTPTGTSSVTLVSGF